MSFSPSSLLQSLPRSEYEKAKTFTERQCDVIAKIAGVKVSYNRTKVPGEQLLNALHRSGFSVQQYREFVLLSQNVKVLTYYKPKSKVAVLIANDKYLNLSKLVTPSIDCDLLASRLNSLGFVTVTLKNTICRELEEVLIRIFKLIPENSYCFIFYAGHGFEICNTKCMLGIDCPIDNISINHCITENFILREVAKSKPDLCVFTMDMCRVDLERSTNPEIYASISLIKPYTVHNNLLIAYATQSSQKAYEMLQILCSKSVNDSYELKAGDSERIIPGASLYVNALCTRLMEDLDISTLLDKVHGDVENSLKKQKPIKVQCGVAKRSLYDPVTGDTAMLLNKLKELDKDYKDFYSVF